MGSLQNWSILRGQISNYDKSNPLHKIFEDKCRNATLSEGIALIYKEKATTYKSMEETANKLSRKMMHLCGQTGPNVDGDYVIAVRMQPTDNLLTTLLAVWKTGAAYLPIHVAAPANRVQHILSEAKPILLITDQGVSTEETFSNVKTIAYQDLARSLEKVSAAPLCAYETLRNPNGNNVAIILYTSGSTGIPKGVRIPHYVVLNRLNWQWQRFPYGKTEEVCVFKTALTFVDSVCEIWGPLLHESAKTVLIIPSDVTKNPEQLVNVLENYEVERLVLVPSLLQAILMYLHMRSRRGGAKLLSKLTLWVCSGESLPSSLVTQLLSYYGDDKHRLCNFYGSTEIMGDVSFYEIKSLSQLKSFEENVPIGEPVFNTILYLLGENSEPVPNGEIGELYVAGHNVAAGYVAARNTGKFVQNHLTTDPACARLFKTGDFARVENGVLIFEGRTDSQVKVRGNRVDMAEIQTALDKFGRVEKSIVLCYKPASMEQEIVAFVKRRSQEENCNNTNDMEDELHEILPSYAIPKIVFVQEFPLLTNGKVDRQTLLKEFEANKGNSKDGTLAEIDYTGIEIGQITAAKCLFETVAQVLGKSIRNFIGRESNFYELGGNSLNSIYTVTKLLAQGYEIGITQFIRAKNLGEVLNIIYSEEEDPKHEINSMMTSKFASYESEQKYQVEMLTDNHKADVIKMIADSFYNKADLEMWLEPKPKKKDYEEIIELMWKPLVEKKLSPIVKSLSSQKYVGVALNFDLYDEPPVELNNNILGVVFEFLEFMEKPVREEKLPVGKRQVLHSFMLGTAEELNAVQNIEVVTLMEQEIIKIAKSGGFAGIFTTNTSPLTQQLGTDVFGYKTLSEMKANDYVLDDNFRPFGKAPDDQVVRCSWKRLY